MNQGGDHWHDCLFRPLHWKKNALEVKQFLAAMMLVPTWNCVTITFNTSRIAFSCEGGVLVLQLEEDEAQRLLRKSVKQDPDAQRSCSTVAEVAPRYGFTEKKVRTWLENGCPFFRIESDIRIDDRLLDVWVEKELGRSLLPTAA